MESLNLKKIISNQIKSNQIKSNQIKSNQIKSNQIKPGFYGHMNNLEINLLIFRDNVGLRLETIFRGYSSSRSFTIVHVSMLKIDMAKNKY